MKIKGTQHWHSAARKIGAHRHADLPSGAGLDGFVRGGEWRVVLALNDDKITIAAGTFRGPLRKGCAAADVTFDAMMKRQEEAHA